MSEIQHGDLDLEQPGTPQSMGQSRAVQKRPLPLRTSYTNESRQQRLDILETHGHELNHMRDMRLDPKSLRGNIESLIGAVEVPVGIAGPLRVLGGASESEVYAPIATSEGALVSSMNRGCIALQLSGGVTARTLKQRMVRAPVFDCESLVRAITLRDWIQSRQGELHLQVRKYSNHAVLSQLEFRILPPSLHVRFVYETGDASGQNMTTVCTWNACQWILKEFEKEHPGVVRHFMIDGNLSTDKKMSAMSAIQGRGHEVVAEAFVPDAVIRRIFQTTAKDMERFLAQGQITGILTGVHGLNINAANAIAAIFTATGQDIACVHESSTAQLYFEARPGGLYASVFLPNLVIGTVGGGVGLAMQKQMLELMECYGPKKASRLAEIIASMVLALELSTGAALASGNFATAHDRLGRNRSSLWLNKEDLTETFMNHLLKTESANQLIVSTKAFSSGASSGSLIMDLTAHITKRPCGLWPYEVQYSHEETPRKIFLKTKVSDHELFLAFEIMGGISSPGLGELLRENRKDNPFHMFHIRELKIAEMTDAPLVDLMPKTLGTLVNEKREIYILAQEYLENIELLNCFQRRDLWTQTHLEAAIIQISAMHAHFLGKTEELESKEWMVCADSHRVKRLSEAHLELARHLQNHSYDWMTDSDVDFHKEYLEQLPRLWLELEAMPRTLIHNDFNPRNLGFRRSDQALRLVAYDWELATVHIPQRDVVELLAFTLPEDFSPGTMHFFLELHRTQNQTRSGLQLSQKQWLRGCEIAVLDLLLQRLPIYGIALSFRQLGFLKPAYQTARRMFKILSGKEVE